MYVDGFTASFEIIGYRLSPCIIECELISIV